MIFCDSFGHYLISQITKKWSIGNYLQFDSGRLGKSVSGGSLSALSLSLPVALTEMWIGWAWKSVHDSHAILGVFNSGAQWINFENLENYGFFRFRTRESKEVNILNFSSKENVWFFFELHLVITATGFTYELRVNEESIAIGGISGLSAVAPYSITNVELYFVNGPRVTSVCDFYIHNIGSLGFLGDCEIQPLFTNTAGNWSEWDGTYQNVDDLNPDDATTVIETNTINEKHSVRFQNIPNFNGTIPAVNFLYCLDLAGKATPIWSYEDEPASLVEGEQENTPSLWSYQWSTRTEDLSGSTWEIGDINSLDCGMRFDE